MPRDSKRIAFLGPAYPFRGGIAHFLTHLESGLSARGHATQFFTFTRQYPGLLFPGKTQLESGPPPAVLPTRVLDPINPISWRTTAKAIRAFRPDALLFKYWMPYFAPSFGFVSRSVRRSGARPIVVVDNALPHERRPGDVALGRYVLRSASGLIVMSDAVRRDLEHAIGVAAPIRQIVHPVYDNFGEPVDRAEARRALGIDPEAKVLLFFGFIRRYKGLHVLLEAMPDVAARVSGVKLIVAGECYGDEAEYREAIARSPDGAIRWDNDYVPDERVALYFSAADLVVQPYVSATQSGVAQIAYHFEKPMVVTDVGGLAEIVPDGEAGLVVPPGDATALGNAIAAFFERGLGEAFAAGVRRGKVRFGWGTLYEAVEEMTRQIDD